MLGFQDIGTWLAYMLTIGATLVCAIYGIVNWNKPAPDQEKREIAEEIAWEQRDPDRKPGKGGK